LRNEHEIALLDQRLEDIGGQRPELAQAVERWVSYGEPGSTLTDLSLLTVRCSLTRLYYVVARMLRRRSAEVMMMYAAIIALILIPSTRIVHLPDKEIVRRSNFVIAATVDGFLCCGTKVPLSVNCHRAVKLTQLEDSVLQRGRRQQTEDLPNGPISR
jgi:hypothetical protein